MTAGVVYLIRHAEAEGAQGAAAPLTQAGAGQALELAAALGSLGIRRIVSSPYVRAVRTVEPLAKALGLKIELDERLVERQVPFNPDVNWREYIRGTFEDLDLVLPNAESSRVAQARAVAALSEIAGGEGPTAVATHGQLLSLALMHFAAERGYADWVAMTNPDVFALDLGSVEPRLERIWGG